jgi:hypothetical protein
MSKPRTRVPGARAWVGYYAASPTDGSPTYWFTDDELRMRAYPDGARYAPMLPPYDAANRQERREDLTDFYEGVYFPWLERVASAIAEDLDAAAARFRTTFGDVMLPRQRDAARRAQFAEQEQAHVRYQQVMAATLVRQGASVAAVARMLCTSWETARARVAAGESLLQADPDGCRQVLADYPRQVDALAAQVLGGDRTGDAFHAAADHFERQQPPGQDWGGRLADRLESDR